MALEINIPFALLPYGTNRLSVPPPVNEQDVQLPVKPQRQKPKSRKTTRASSGTPLVVSDDLSQPVVPDVEDNQERTGIGYKGPFIPDNKIALNNQEPDRFYIPQQQLHITPAKDSIVSRALAPDESELEAARNGMRWHWALEHRFMPPGSKWNQTVWNGVDRENAWLARMLQQRGQDLKQVGAPIGNARERANMQNMWRQFLKDVQNGHFDTYGDGTSEGAQVWAEQFKKQYEDRFGTGSSVELPPVSEILGKRTELNRKVFTDLETTINDTEYFATELKRWYDNGDFASPKQNRLIQTLLDKVGQRFTARLGGDSTNMADAEKIRIQIQYLPQASKDKVYEAINRYRKAVASAIRASASNEWLQNNWTKVNEVTQTDVDNDTSAIRSISALADVLTGKLGNNVAGLPHNVQAALVGYKNLLDSYMNQMVLAANVAPSVAYEMARYLHDQSVANYNEMAARNKRPERRSLGLTSVDASALDSMIPVDALIEPPIFPLIKIQKAPKGDISSNPQTGKEGKVEPAPAGTDWGGF